MIKACKALSLVFVLLAGAQSAWSFSLLGPEEDYQVEALGYRPPDFGLLPVYRNFVKNIGDEFRWNTRTLYYTFDPEFTDYFGSNGIAAIDAAFAMLNSLSNVSHYSPGLTEFPLESTSVNYSAQALRLLDLKSYTLELMMERYGLADPDHFTWTLRNRVLPANAQCPAYIYSVIKRNFDPITWEESSYVNGNLFTYRIVELCPVRSKASAEESLGVDPLASFSSAVASGTPYLGSFRRGLTRDDIGGIRYLLSSTNVNWEQTPANSLVVFTNTSQSVLAYPSNAHLFAEQALTNDAGALAALYPGLIITGTSNYFVNVVETNITTSFAPQPYAPVGSPPILVYTTNLTTSVATRYVHAFANVLTWSNQALASFSTVLDLPRANRPWSLLTTNIGPSPYAPAGSGVLVTNVTLQHYVEPNSPSGSFFILPTNLCAYQVLKTQLVQLVITTNFLTNTFTTFTNQAGGSNAFSYYEYSQSELTYFTNTILEVYPASYLDGIASLVEGIEKISFVRRDYDSLLGRFFQPFTNHFALTEVTNSARRTRYVQRTVSSPDIVFSADDITSAPESDPLTFFEVTLSTPNFVTSDFNVDGPGTLSPGINITFNKVGSFILNAGPSRLTEAAGSQGYRWGSFGGTTNAPVVYPVGTDLQTIENLALIGLTNATANGSYLLPDGTNGVVYSYSITNSVVGGTAPYAWDQSSSLFGWLNVSAEGIISGTPTGAGDYSFTIGMTDHAGRFVNFPVTLNIY
ncbi:MAG: hypothetical protein MUE94_01030 [Verrucomicrobia bacterium]|jgi:hypothetical protein|nr:hypothetical protein [Verrucomicrobiota bacterium]